MRPSGEDATWSTTFVLARFVTFRWSCWRPNESPASPPSSSPYLSISQHWNQRIQQGEAAAWRLRRPAAAAAPAPELWCFSWSAEGHLVHERACDGLHCAEQGEQKLTEGRTSEERARLVLLLSAMEALLRRALFASALFRPMGSYAVLGYGQGDALQWELFFTPHAIGVDFALLPTRLTPLQPASLSPLIGEKVLAGPMGLVGELQAPQQNTETPVEAVIDWQALGSCSSHDVSESVPIRLDNGTLVSFPLHLLFRIDPGWPLLPTGRPMPSRLDHQGRTELWMLHQAEVATQSSMSRRKSHEEEEEEEDALADTPGPPSSSSNHSTPPEKNKDTTRAGTQPSPPVTDSPHPVASPALRSPPLHTAASHLPVHSPVPSPSPARKITSASTPRENETTLTPKKKEATAIPSAASFTPKNVSTPKAVPSPAPEASGPTRPTHNTLVRVSTGNLRTGLNSPGVQKVAVQEGLSWENDREIDFNMWFEHFDDGPPASSPAVATPTAVPPPAVSTPTSSMSAPPPALAVPPPVKEGPVPSLPETPASTHTPSGPMATEDKDAEQLEAELKNFMADSSLDLGDDIDLTDADEMRNALQAIKRNQVQHYLSTPSPSASPSLQAPATSSPYPSTPTLSKMINTPVSVPAPVPAPAPHPPPGRIEQLMDRGSIHAETPLRMNVLYPQLTSKMASLQPIAQQIRHYNQTELTRLQNRLQGTPLAFLCPNPYQPLTFSTTRPSSLSVQFTSSLHRSSSRLPPHNSPPRGALGHFLSLSVPSRTASVPFPAPTQTGSPTLPGDVSSSETEEVAPREAPIRKEDKITLMWPTVAPWLQGEHAWPRMDVAMTPAQRKRIRFALQLAQPNGKGSPRPCSGALLALLLSDTPSLSQPPLQLQHAPFHSSAPSASLHEQEASLLPSRLLQLLFEQAASPLDCYSTGQKEEGLIPWLLYQQFSQAGVGASRVLELMEMNAPPLQLATQPLSAIRSPSWQAKHHIPALMNCLMPLLQNAFTQCHGPLRSGEWTEALQGEAMEEEEPMAECLPAPSLLVGYKKTWLEVQATEALRVWEKTRLQPYAARKNMSYLVMCPFAPHSEGHKCTERFLQSLSATYEVCHLGSHRPAAFSKFRMGFVHCHTPTPGTPTEQLASMERACRALGQELSHCKTYADNSWLVYIVHPFASPHAQLAVTRCAATLQTQATRRQVNLVVQVLSFPHLLHPPCGRLTYTKEVALTVFNKCRRIAYSGPSDSQPGYQLYEPYCILSTPTPTPTPTSLHCAYCLSWDRRTLLMILTDSRGELLEHRVLPFSSSDSTSLPSLVLSACLAFLDELPHAVSFSSFSIGKLGSLDAEELQEWKQLWHSPPWVGTHRFQWVRVYSLRFHRGGMHWYQVPLQPHPAETWAVYPPERFTIESPTTPHPCRTAFITGPSSQSLPQNLEINLYFCGSPLEGDSDSQTALAPAIRSLTRQLWALSFLNRSPAFLDGVSRLPYHFALLLRFSLLLDEASRTK